MHIQFHHEVLSRSLWKYRLNLENFERDCIKSYKRGFYKLTGNFLGKMSVDGNFDAPTHLSKLYN